MTTEEKKKDDFKHIVRILNTDLPGAETVEISLTGIPGIGRRTARIIAENAGVERTTTMGDLSKEEVNRLKEAVESYEENVPPWMLNRQKDIYTGEDHHLFGTDVTLTRQEDINLMKKIRSYKGIRHERGHRVRGQRTRSTGRKGATVGVSKKKIKARAKEEKEE